MQYSPIKNTYETNLGRKRAGNIKLENLQHECDHTSRLARYDNQECLLRISPIPRRDTNLNRSSTLRHTRSVVFPTQGHTRAHKVHLTWSCIHWSVPCNAQGVQGAWVGARHLHKGKLACLHFGHSRPKTSPSRTCVFLIFHTESKL